MTAESTKAQRAGRMTLTRRTFLQTSAAVIAGTPLGLPAADKSTKPLASEVGVTVSSFSGHLSKRSQPGKFTLLDLPAIMRNELDMRVIDLNTSAFASVEPSYLDRLREAARKAGCLLTNLKLNQQGFDMNSRDKAVRETALREYERWIDAASRLGSRWARPLPMKARPDMTIHVASYRRLADYAAKRNVQMLVENYGWMQSDPESVVRLIKAIGSNVAASPDTGNWDSNDIRYQGLAKTFPLAVTCDFKARKLGPKGEHRLYGLKRCFSIGWSSGFRGPWCLEHANRDRKTLFRELAMLREMLRKWMAEQS